MKTQRKTKAAPASQKARVAKKVRGSVPKTTPGSDGNYPLAVYEHLRIGIVECSLNGQYIDVNEEFCRMLGYSRKDLLHFGVKDLTYEDDYILDIKLHEELVAGNIPFYALEKRYVKKDGQVIWVELTRSLVLDESGQPRCTLGVVVDISEQKNVERVLRESAENLRLATEAARMFKWELDFKKQLYTFADNFVHVLGFSGGLLPQNSVETVWKLSPAEDVRALQEATARAIENHDDLHSLQYRMINPEDGQTAWLEVNAKIVYDEQGRARRMFGVAQNITESKRAQEQIRTISTMSAENPNPVMRLTPEGGILYANPASAPLLATWQEEAHQAIPDELQKVVREAFSSGLKKEIAVEHQGSVFYCTLVPIRETGYVNFYATEVTEHKRMEDALRESEARFRALVSQATAGIAQSDPETKLIFVNPRFCDMLGYSESEVLGKTIWELTYTDDLTENQRLFNRLMGDGDSYQFEKRFVRKDGSLLWANVSVTTVLDRVGKPTGGVGVIVDVSERKRAEEALAEFARQQEALYRLSDELHHSNSLEDVYSAALNAILRGLQCDRASILLFDDSSVMRFVAWRGLSEAYRRATEGHSPWGADEENPYPICVNDVQTSDLSGSLKATIEAEGIRSLAFIPLISNGKLIGKFMVYFDTLHECSDVEIELGLMIARQLAFGIDRKRAEADLRESEERYRTIVDTANEGIWHINLEAQTIYLNEPMAQLLGYSVEEVIGRKVSEFCFEEDIPKAQARIVSNHQGNFEHFDFRFRRKDGREVLVLGSTSPVRDATGTVIGALGMFVDVTERKRAEEKLRQSEERFRTMANIVPSVMWTAAPDGTITYANDQWFHYAGITPEENATHWPELVLHPDDYERCMNEWRRALETVPDEYQIEVRNRRSDGEYRWFQTRAVPARDSAGNVIAWYGVTSDIHERKQAEERLRASEERLRVTFNTAVVGFATLTPEARFVEVNEAFCRIVGYTRQELLAMDCAALTHPFFLESTAQHVQQLISGEIPSFVLEKLYVRKDGVEIWVQNSVSLVRDAEGAPLHLIAICQDVTERKWAVEALRESEERHRGLVNQTIAGIAGTDLTGKFTMVNDHYCEITGYPRERLLNEMRMQDITHPDDLPTNQELFGRLITDGASFEMEKRYIRSDGSLVWVHNSVSAVTGTDGKPQSAVVVVIDVTERKRAEEQLRQSAEFDAFRVALTDALRPHTDPAKIVAEAMRLLGEKLEVDRVLYSEIEYDDETIQILDNYVKEGVPKLTGRASLSDYGKARGPLSMGQNLVIMDAATSPEMDEKDRSAFAALGIRSGLAIPLIKDGRWIATLGAHHGTPRAWTENQVKFMEETAERTWSALERARAQEKLRASETLYRAIARSIPGGGVYVVDKDFRYLIAEGAVTEAFGLTREMLEGHTVSEVFPDERGARMEERLRRNFAGETIGFETKHNERIYWTQLAPLSDSLGQALLLTIDITERKQAEEALRIENERFMRFVDSNIIGIIIGDPDGKVVLANDYYLQLLGVSREDFNAGRVDWKKFTPPEWLPADEKAIQELRERGVCEPYEKEYVRGDGTRVPVYIADAMLPGPGNEIAAFVLDITERKQAEKALRQSEERFVRFMQHLPGLAWIKDVEGRYIYANAAVEQAFGTPREELYGRTDLQIFPAEVAAQFRKNDQQVLTSEKGLQTIETLQQPDGLLHYSLVNKFPIPGPDGNVGLIGGTAFDMTERLQAEEALRKSEERYRSLFDLVPIGVYTCDAKGLIREYNHRAVELWGRAPATNDPKEKYCGSHRLYYPDGRWMPHEACPMSQALNGEVLEPSEAEVIIERPDGSRRNVVVHPLLLRDERGQIIEAINCIYDITERKRAEAALYESEERFKAILRQATAGIIRQNAEGKLIFVNEAFCKMVGYTEAELLGKMTWEFTYEDDVAENKRLYERLMMEGIPFKLEKRLLRADGSMIWVEVSVSPVMDADGKPHSAVAVEVDITGRKRAEEALQQLNQQLEGRVQKRTATIQAINQSLREEIAERKRIEEALRASEATARANEEKLRTLFDLLPVGISFLDPDGRILQMNSALPNIVRLTKQQLLSQSYKGRKYIRADGTPMPPEEFASARALALEKTVYNVETGIVLENGELIWTSVSAAPVDVADVGVVVVTIDITESKRAEQALQESHTRLRILSQRLVEVQEEERRALARELHDRVGQTLAALNINLIIINSQLSPDVAQQIGVRLNDSMRLVAETIALVRDVMTDLRPAVLDDYGLEAALESHLNGFTSRYSINVTFEKSDRPIPRLGPSVEMTFLRIAQEALMNTARHARAEHVKLSLRQDDEAICLTVHDDGIGIESWQDANRPGSHGMTIMRERAEAFGGTLKVRSAPGQGTIVEASIPFKSDSQINAQKEQHL